MTMAQTYERRAEIAGAGAGKRFGPVAAVFLAAGIGALVLGALTTLAEASEDIASALEWSESVGPLMGKSLLAAAAFFVSWGILAVALRRRDPRPGVVWTWVVVLLALGLVGTFPIFFEAFAPPE
jgi:hypothetical protein